MAASGGYYMPAPADEVYVTPASTVGSVGVRAVVRGRPRATVVATAGAVRR